MMWLRLVHLLAILLPLAVGAQYPFSATLLKDSSGQPFYELQWTFDVTQQTITFNVLVNTTGWVGFGLSRDGGMIGSDVVTGWVNSSGAYLQDRFADTKALPSVDPSQDWSLLSGNLVNGWTNLTFTRKWITGDTRDRDVVASTARVVFSWGAIDPVNQVPLYHGASGRGTISLNLLGGLVNKPALPADAKNVTLTMRNVTIPATESTTYWCAGYKLPDEFNQKKYIVRYSPVISSNIYNNLFVHHVLLYPCEFLNDTTDLGAGFACNSGAVTPTLKACRNGQIVAGWAVGGEEFIYPEGISIGLGGPKQQYVVLEVHYNNPDLRPDIIDSSGLTLVYTSTIPKHEAGILSLGVSASSLLIIPPKAESFVVRAFCIPNCTRQSIPPAGITVFADFLHTHLTGTGLTLHHMRWNDSCGAYQELPHIDQNLQYDFNLQQFTILPRSVTVLPGDLLEVECIYNTMDRSNITLGGEATTDEMCIIFVLYYPFNDFRNCYSKIHPQAYEKFNHNYFSSADAMTLNHILASKGNNFTNTLKNYYGSLQWNQSLISSFQHAASEDYYLSAVCNVTNETLTSQLFFTPPVLTCKAQPTTVVAGGVAGEVQASDVKGGLVLFIVLLALVPIVC